MNNITLFFQGLRWQDLVDIGVSSFILFRFYILFRGTYVLRVVIGIGLLWVFRNIAIAMGLVVTSWAIQGLTAVAAFIIIVVFRNEIRSVLQARNLKSILWGGGKIRQSTPVDILIESVFDMARRRVGALIIVPGREDLGEIVHGGVAWKGLVSKEMINAVFSHSSPVHDGAAVIQGDRITEVGVVLPLSVRKDMPFGFGTRHRAAAGLAESTDAMVVVVSEERGDVTVAKGSEMIKIPGADALRDHLLDHLGTREPSRKAVNRERLEIAAAAAASVVFITGVWFSFSRGIDSLATFDIPLEYVNRDPGMEIFDTSTNHVQILVSSSSVLIESIRPEKIKVRVNLEGAVKGRNSLPITSGDISLPPGVELKSVKPSTVEVTLDNPARKKAPIQVHWSGKLPAHLILESLVLSRNFVTIIGGEQILEKISTIYTQPVPLDNIIKSGSVTARILLNPPSLKIGEGEGDEVRIDYKITERKE